MLLSRYFALFTLHFLVFSVSLAASSIDEDITRIQNAYDNLGDIKGSFVQKNYMKDLKRTDTYRGEFFIKKPDKMKWEYKGEVAQEILINDDEILIYQKKERQAFRGKFDRDTYGQAPVALLGGFGRIQEVFFVSEKNGSLLLKPKVPMGGIVSVEIKPSEGEFPIGSFIVNDSRSNRIEITLKDVKVNTGLRDGLFKSTLPKDTRIHELNPRD